MCRPDEISPFMSALGAAADPRLNNSSSDSGGSNAPKLAALILFKNVGMVARQPPQQVGTASTTISSFVG